MSDPAVHIGGAEKLRALGAAVRALGDDRTIFRTLNQRFAALFPDVRAAVKTSAVKTLPRAGGFGARVAASSFRLSSRRGTATAGVSVVISGKSVKGKADLFDLDESGTFRSPLWGNRHHWYPHTTTAGFASDPWSTSLADEFGVQVEAAIDDAIASVGL